MTSVGLYNIILYLVVVIIYFCFVLFCFFFLTMLRENNNIMYCFNLRIIGCVKLYINTKFFNGHSDDKTNFIATVVRHLNVSMTFSRQFWDSYIIVIVKQRCIGNNNIVFVPNKGLWFMSIKSFDFVTQNDIIMICLRSE